MILTIALALTALGSQGGTGTNSRYHSHQARVPAGDQSNLGLQDTTCGADICH
jgi:hypothetical protein